MKINEVEQLLGTSKANIRFYEKQGLLRPERTENRYRDYSQADVERLKTVIVLRKLGISVQNIGDILQGKMALQDAIRENITALETQIEQLEGALNLSRQIAREEAETLDTDRYWDMIQEKEAQGEKFADVVAEYWTGIMRPDITWKFGLDENASVKQIILRVLIVSLVYGLLGSRKNGDFLINFLHWPIIILFVSVITFLIFWIGKRRPKITAVLNTILAIICVVALCGVLLLLVGGGLVALWNWIFH